MGKEEKEEEEEEEEEEKDLLPNHAIVQKPPVRLLPALGRIDRRPAAHFCRAGEDGAHDEKH